MKTCESPGCEEEPTLSFVVGEKAVELCECCSFTIELLIEYVEKRIAAALESKTDSSEQDEEQ